MSYNKPYFIQFGCWNNGACGENNNNDIAIARKNVRELNHEIMGWLESDNVDQAIFASKQVMHQLLMIEMYKNNIELLLKGSN